MGLDFEAKSSFKKINKVEKDRQAFEFVEN
jgi:hypothetical protein